MPIAAPSLNLCPIDHFLNHDISNSLSFPYFPTTHCQFCGNGKIKKPWLKFIDHIQQLSTISPRRYTQNPASIMRVPYVADSITPEDASEEAIVERVRQRRLPGPLLDLDRALLHCPPVADGWNSLFGSIRSRTTLSTDIRELAICRVAVLTKSQYEWSQHAPLAAEAGVNMTALKGSGEGLTGNQLAVLHYTDSMTQDVFVSDDMFQELGRFFGDREIVEITATIAIYNCCSRFLVALDVGERNEQIQVEKW